MAAVRYLITLSCLLFTAFFWLGAPGLLADTVSVPFKSELPVQINQSFDIKQFIQAQQSGKIEQPVKSELDSRQYRYLKLSNQLTVLLVSDPQAQTAAAALNLSAGSNQNPHDRPGLAHLLEHVLLLGSEKYPSGEYQQFIAKSGGTHNAVTTAENTQFYFSVHQDVFEPALDRFAELFINPDFNQARIESERQVVDAEFASNLLDDVRREWDVIRELVNPEHPASTFSVGNSISLGDMPDRMIRDDLINFYQNWYSADRMSLVVVGKQPLAVLQSWIESRFTKIPQRAAVSPTPYPALFAADALPASVDIQSQKNTRRLSFRFPVAQDQQYVLGKPYQFIAHLLGHENKGSFISLLKDLGWAESLHAGLTFDSRYDAFFQINIQLTESGLRAREQIVSLLFFVIEKIGQEGFTEWRYKELQLMADVAFQFSEKQSPLQTATELATSLQYYSPKDIVRGPWIYQGFNEKQLRECLSHLRPDNVLQVLMTPDIKAFRVSKYYSVPYTVRQGIADVLPIKTSVRQRFSLPQANPFLPEKMIVKSGYWLGDKSIKNRPELLVDKNSTRIWFQQDHHYNRPHSAINLRLIVPPEKMTADRAALNHLFAAMVNDELNDRLYFASLAGISLVIQPHTRGLDLRIMGFSNRQSLLLNQTIAVLNKADFSERQFQRVKNRLMRFWINQRKDAPYQQLLGTLPSLLVSPEWTAADLAKALENIHYQQMLQFSRQFLWDAHIDGLIYGNYLPQEATKLSAIIEHGLQSRQTGRNVAHLALQRLSLTQTQPWLETYSFAHPDKVLALYLQAPSTTEADTVNMMLLRQILQPAFFQALRTEQQSGYLVSILPSAMLQLEGSVFLIQSPSVSEIELQKRIDQFLEQQIPLIRKNFAQYQSSLLQSLREPANSISEQNNRYWHSLLSGDLSFDRKERLIQALEVMSVDSVVAYYQQVFQNKNRRLWLSTADIPLKPLAN